MSTMWQGCLPHTDYFEMRSSSGHDYGVWVTTPPNYDPATASAPVVYVLDGNWAVGMTAPLIVTQLDPMQAIQPYVQVSVGYAGEEAERWERLRNRDLVPPGEPIAKEYIDAVEIGVERGVTTREQADAYLAELSDSRGDMFLNFLTDDLHPRIERDYGTAPGGHGLFGYSYGGLFSLYAWLTTSTFFESIGAGSPGIVHADSQVFARLEAMGDTLPDTKLHVTFNEQEMLGDLAVYQNLAKNAATFLHRLTSRSGSVTSALMHETHVTGLQASFLSYLRTCRAQ
ncbi:MULTISPECIES: alpha/beta hydrolase [Streptomyces]|uniref:Alpha/beta hydrolase-fold protein n=1 Tax=Streptomyces glycanivorans TaxID=3033808 RepID=A0ABY9J2L5_9ACTN|nr:MULTISPECIES: alpha/beta hydrolase-fold protein [unclassified Streptomyces]WSQ75601.1 alpha/beta hydrolase-fold protein [Streptomyces sp. NBC_01213]TXS12596.1 alpha/beta hydrolase [Streptomyces sp. wa22]WLQ62092.1 alpha/beta hydrolase-fold protein [Streptomyces sp. Alt3]WSQ82853.1 alpha/beta hydrolase-fold protein [Streptomyces sp. NBC_01212]WSR04526.1 alpha/beta hydrolase-fold protein [Streptomyces sp. NBC_01208]